MVAGNSAAQRLRLRGWGKRRADWRLSWPGQIVCRHQATSFLDACWPVEMAPVSAKIVGDQSLNVRRIWAVFAVYATSDNASYVVFAVLFLPCFRRFSCLGVCLLTLLPWCESGLLVL